MVKVIAKSNELFRLRNTHRLMVVRPLSVRRRHTDMQCGVEDHLFIFDVLSVGLLFSEEWNLKILPPPDKRQ